jgi:GDP-L-fucose synthase
MAIWPRSAANFDHVFHKRKASIGRIVTLGMRSMKSTNLYGPGDNYHPENSHFIPALIRRFHEAKVSNTSEVVIWGTGTPSSEFLHVDDMAAASVFVMELDKKTYDQSTEPMQSHINIGFGGDVTIAELAKVIGDAVGYQGNISFHVSKPDGSPRKWMDSSKLNRLGWHPKVNLEQGLSSTYHHMKALMVPT